MFQFVPLLALSNVNVFLYFRICFFDISCARDLNQQVKLYVGNLSFDSTQESIKPLFEKYGEVVDCFLPTDRESGKVRGFCFVTMPAAAAEEACNGLNGYELDGRAL